MYGNRKDDFEIRGDRTFSNLSLDDDALDRHRTNLRLSETPGGEFVGFVNQMFKTDRVSANQHEEINYSTGMSASKRASIGPDVEIPIQKEHKNNKSKTKSKRMPVINAYANPTMTPPSTVLPTPPPPPPPPPVIQLTPVKFQRSSKTPVSTPPIQSPLSSLLDEFRQRVASNASSSESLVQASTLTKTPTEENVQGDVKARSATLGHLITNRTEETDIYFPKPSTLNNTQRKGKDAPIVKPKSKKLTVINAGHSNDEGYDSWKETKHDNNSDDEFNGFHNKMFKL